MLLSASVCRHFFPDTAPEIFVHRWRAIRPDIVWVRQDGCQFRQCPVRRTSAAEQFYANVPGTTCRKREHDGQLLLHPPSFPDRHTQSQTLIPAKSWRRRFAPLSGSSSAHHFSVWQQQRYTSRQWVMSEDHY